jgi:hypothetical protein
MRHAATWTAPEAGTKIRFKARKEKNIERQRRFLGRAKIGVTF